MTPAGTPSKELRLALAMRGGVSLAVWIGGAVAEIDRLRRSTDADPAAERDAFWQEILEASGYGNVVVDVMSGASAGGLNGVLYAASQVYDFPYEAIKDVWVAVGSTHALVRKEGPWLSLFDGDGSFYETLRSQLVRLAEERGARGPARASTRIDLSLSATLIEPVERPLPSPSDETLVDRRYGSGFRFHHSPERARTDFPALDDPAFEVAMRRLAMAGRTTSSYPAAFEAATFRSTRREVFGGPPAPAEDGWLDMDGALVDRAQPSPAAPAGEFVVADGGILDNIPIGLALDAIAAAPADGPTGRVLLYLQPGASRPATPVADATTSAEARLAERRDSISVITGIARTRISGETINADIAQLEAHNEGVARAAALRAGEFGALTTERSIFDAANEAADHYRLTRAGEDARGLFSMLSDPLGTFGDDPFPATLGGTPVPDAVWRSPIAGWMPSQREGLEASMAAAFAQGSAVRSPHRGTAATGPDPSAVFAVGVKPLLRVTQLLIEWSRWIEADPAGAAPFDGLPTASETKARLYTVLSFLTSALDRPRRLMWVAAAVACPPDHRDAFATMAVEAADALCRASEDDVARIVSALLADDTVALAAFASGAHSRIEARFRGRREGDALDQVAHAGADIRMAVVGRVLAPIASSLSKRAQAMAIRVDEPTHPAGPGQLLDGVLRRTAPGDWPRMFAALEIVCYPEFAFGLPGRRPIRFHRLSSANRTPIAPAFEEVLRAARDQGLWWDGGPAAEDPARQEGIHVNLKLAGNELANFSAFLVDDWRRNDWMWGRLDAVPTLVDILVTPEAVRTLVGGRTIEDAADHLVGPDHPWRRILEPHVWDERVAEVHAELAVLLADGAVDGDTVHVPTVRNAMIARRQWKILSEELGTADPYEAARTRKFGAETLRDSGRRNGLTSAFDELLDAAGHALVANVNLSRPGGFALSSVRGRVVRAAVRWGGGKGISALTTPPRSGRHLSKLKVVTAAAVAVYVVLAVVGTLVLGAGFVAGLVVGTLAIVAAASWLFRRARDVLRTSARDDAPAPVIDLTATRPAPAPAAPSEAVTSP